MYLMIYIYIYIVLCVGNNGFNSSINTKLVVIEL